jgi:hypothetical protein
MANYQYNVQNLVQYYAKNYVKNPSKTFAKNISFKKYCAFLLLFHNVLKHYSQRIPQLFYTYKYQLIPQFHNPYYNNNYIN